MRTVAAIYNLDCLSFPGLAISELHPQVHKRVEFLDLQTLEALEVHAQLLKLHACVEFEDLQTLKVHAPILKVHACMDFKHLSEQYSSIKLVSPAVLGWSDSLYGRKLFRQKLKVHGRVDFKELRVDFKDCGWTWKNTRACLQCCTMSLGTLLSFRGSSEFFA